MRYSRFGLDLSSSQYEHGLNNDRTITDSTDSLMKGSDGHTRASIIYGFAGIRALSLVVTPLDSALNSCGD